MHEFYHLSSDKATELAISNVAGVARQNLEIRLENLQYELRLYHG